MGEATAQIKIQKLSRVVVFIAFPSAAISKTEILTMSYKMSSLSPLSVSE